MTTQDRLFYDSFEDATADVVRHLGGPKVVGQKLWPAKSPEAARSRLLDCLNPDRAEKFSHEEIVALGSWGRESNCHALMNYFAQEMGYTRPSPVNPADEQAELMRAYIDAVREQRKLTERLERAGLRVVGQA